MVTLPLRPPVAAPVPACKSPLVPAGPAGADSTTIVEKLGELGLLE